MYCKGVPLWPIWCNFWATQWWKLHNATLISFDTGQRVTHQHVTDGQTDQWWKLHNATLISFDTGQRVTHQHVTDGQTSRSYSYYALCIAVLCCAAVHKRATTLSLYSNVYIGPSTSTPALAKHFTNCHGATWGGKAIIFYNLCKALDQMKSRHVFCSFWRQKLLQPYQLSSAVLANCWNTDTVEEGTDNTSFQEGWPFWPYSTLV